MRGSDGQVPDMLCLSFNKVHRKLAPVKRFTLKIADPHGAPIRAVLGGIVAYDYPVAEMYAEELPVLVPPVKIRLRPSFVNAIDLPGGIVIRRYDQHILVPVDPEAVDSACDSIRRYNLRRLPGLSVLAEDLENIAPTRFRIRKRQIDVIADETNEGGTLFIRF